MNRDPVNVLVLSVGGNIAQGILKALALSSLPCRVIGACVSPLAYGLYTTDQAHISPAADDPNFPDWLMTICRRKAIQAVLAGNEAVVSVLSREAEKLRKETGAVCVVARPECIELGLDKLLTCAWLRDNGFKYPRFADASDALALRRVKLTCGYPLIAKPRRGKGSEGIILITNDRELEAAGQRLDYVVQESVGTADEEYTVGCFCDKDGKVRGAIAMKRTLSQGTTWRAEIGAYPEVRAEAMRIAACLAPEGPCNIQLRMSDRGPVCFEINVRFSGTTPIRARFGFNEVEAALRHLVFGEPAYDLPLITAGVALRYWNEIYVDPSAVDALRNSGRLENPASHHVVVEDYGMRY
ncbi:MAG: ATP-grasp domain-containing protein [Candidatus Hydrogenedentes bacterium]|nr:ATP-grasp domain-containing protein [Candidatus Hydrogenedentota bacterium]